MEVRMKIMKILYDHQIFTSQIYGGISRYFTVLVEHMHNDKGDLSYLFPSFLSNNYYLKKSNVIKTKKFFDGVHFRGKYRIINTLNRRISKKNICQGNYEIFHPTYYDPYFLKYIGNKPFVLTIYDMIHEIYPEMFTKKDKTAQWKKLLADKANKIIAISKCTKRDIIKHLRIEENKIEVIYLGSSLFQSEDEKEHIDISIPEKYLLYVGSRDDRKNFIFFIKAIADFLKNNKGIQVICAGGHSFNDNEMKVLEEYEIQDQVHQIDIDDKGLTFLYKRAIAFIYPSLYEGFGLPILESFSCGCPVICSNSSSLPEVAGEAALYFDPLSKEDIFEKISEIYNSKNSRKYLIKEGYNQLKKFSWGKTYQETKEVYRSIL
jgi:glycosyltransferase involved in cell wall biosynthesis